MNTPKDVLGKDLAVGQRVGCAFSYSQASVGYIRLGILEEMQQDYIKVRWENENRLSPKMKYGSNTRWIIL